jgi:hypothetical protein
VAIRSEELLSRYAFPGRYSGRIRDISHAERHHVILQVLRQRAFPAAHFIPHQPNSRRNARPVPPIVCQHGAFARAATPQAFAGWFRFRLGLSTSHRGSSRGAIEAQRPICATKPQQPRLPLSLRPSRQASRGRGCWVTVSPIYLRLAPCRGAQKGHIVRGISAKCFLCKIHGPRRWGAHSGRGGELQALGAMGAGASLGDHCA